MASFEQIEEYAEHHTRALSDSHARLWKETHEKTDHPGMMVGPLEGSLLRLLVRLTSAKRVLEIGMFTGYSALAMAEALPEDGKLITCDVNPATTEIARRYFAESAHGHKIEIKLGPARETLKALKGPFDLCFIDADKESYGDYYDCALDLVRRAGAGVGVVGRVAAGASVQFSTLHSTERWSLGTAPLPLDFFLPAAIIWMMASPTAGAQEGEQR